MVDAPPFEYLCNITKKKKTQPISLMKHVIEQPKGMVNEWLQLKLKEDPTEILIDC